MSSSVGERRVLVTGASGQLGTAFRSVFPRATFLASDALDITDTAAVPVVIASHRPAAVINCAAYTNVDAAERDEEQAIAVNGEAVGTIAQVCADLAIPFVTYSSDYVFDGRASAPYVESDPVDPLGAYGRSKLLGERLAVERHPAPLVVRTSWVISATHDNFVSTILRRAKHGSVRVVDDQYGRPTIAADLAVATAAALADGLEGIVHLANEGETTWWNLAGTAVRLAGLDAALVEPCSTDEFPTAAVRPTYSVLGTERSDGPRLPKWEASLPPLVSEQMRRIAVETTG